MFVNMDTVPTTSSALVSPPKKRKRLDLGRLSIAEKQCILNMYKQSVTNDPNMTITDIVSKIVDTMGVVISTVYRTIKEYRQTGKIMSSKHAGGRSMIVATYDEEIKASVRQIVHDFFYKSEIPTLNKILNEMKSRQDLPNMSHLSLYKFMKEINIKYMKRNRKSILIERDDIARWRQKYLRGIKEYRKEGHAIYYLDETWVNEGHIKGRVWGDNGIKNLEYLFGHILHTGQFV